MSDPYGRRGRFSTPVLPVHRRRRRIAKLGVGALHPACRSAYQEGLHDSICSRCQWLLSIDTPAAAYHDAHSDDGSPDEDL